MKINAIKYDTTLKQGYSEVHRDPQAFKERNYAGACDKKIEDKNKFSGNFTGKSEIAADAFRKAKFKDKIFESKAFNWITKFAEEHNVAGSALMALFLAGAVRPATIMALPGKKDKEDKIYASGHSMASGIIGFAVSTAVTSPWDQGVKNIMNNYKDHYDKVIENIKNGVVDNKKGVPELKYSFGLLDKKYSRIVELEKQILDKAGKIEKKALLKQIDAIQLSMKNVTDWAIAIPRSILTIALIPPILKYVFGMEKKSKSAPAPDVSQQNSEKMAEVQKQSAQTVGMDGFMKKSIEEMKGGAN